VDSLCSPSMVIPVAYKSDQNQKNLYQPM